MSNNQNTNSELDSWDLMTCTRKRTEWKTIYLRRINYVLNQLSIDYNIPKDIEDQLIAVILFLKNEKRQIEDLDDIQRKCVFKHIEKYLVEHFSNDYEKTCIKSLGLTSKYSTMTTIELDSSDDDDVVEIKQEIKQIKEEKVVKQEQMKLPAIISNDYGMAPSPYINKTDSLSKFQDVDMRVPQPHHQMQTPINYIQQQSIAPRSFLPSHLLQAPQQQYQPLYFQQDVPRQQVTLNVQLPVSPRHITVSIHESQVEHQNIPQYQSNFSTKTYETNSVRNRCKSSFVPSSSSMKIPQKVYSSTHQNSSTHQKIPKIDKVESLTNVSKPTENLPMINLSEESSIVNEVQPEKSQEKSNEKPTSSTLRQRSKSVHEPAGKIAKNQESIAKYQMKTVTPLNPGKYNKPSNENGERKIITIPLKPQLPKEPIVINNQLGDAVKNAMKRSFIKMNPDERKRFLKELEADETVENDEDVPSTNGIDKDVPKKSSNNEDLPSTSKASNEVINVESHDKVKRPRGRPKKVTNDEKPQESNKVKRKRRQTVSFSESESQSNNKSQRKIRSRRKTEYLSNVYCELSENEQEEIQKTFENEENNNSIEILNPNENENQIDNDEIEAKLAALEKDDDNDDQIEAMNVIGLIPNNNQNVEELDLLDEIVELPSKPRKRRKSQAVKRKSSISIRDRLRPRGEKRILIEEHQKLLKECKIKLEKE